MEYKLLLKELSEASGVSGYEGQVRALASQAFAPWSDEVRHDILGNVIALKRGIAGEGGRRLKVMLAAHLDEIGLIVTQIEKGFLRFAPVGGVDRRTLLGHEVMVHGRADMPGIIATVPPHLLSAAERDKMPDWDQLFIDVGMDAASLAEKVRVGDLVTMRRTFRELEEGRLTGKAFDDRAAVVALAHCLELLAGFRHRWDVFAVATVQEEVGLQGATTGAYGIWPDVAIAVDVGFGDMPGVPERDSIKMDGGPSIAIGANIHPLVYDHLVKAAKDQEIPYQIEPIPAGTGTDAWAIQVAREGIPTGLLSIPLRYMHTSVETLVENDIARTGRLLAHFIASLDDDFASLLGVDR